MDFLIEHDYVAKENDELSIKKGDIIKNAKIYEEGWMIGTLRGKEGVFPDNFGREYKESKRNESNTDDSRENSNDEELEKKSDEIPKSKVKGIGFGNIFDNKTITLKTTSVNKNRTIDEDVSSKSDKPPTTNIEKPVGELYKVLFAYEATASDELQMDEGDVVTVLNKDTGDDGWWFGRNGSGKTGLFPDNYVGPMKPEEVNKFNKIVLNKVPPPTIHPKPTPSRPQALDPTIASARTMLKPTPAPIDKEDGGGSGGVSFDNTGHHVPLVGPTADRPKRPGRRTPNSMHGNHDIKEEKSSVAPVYGTPSSANNNNNNSHNYVSHNVKSKVTSSNSIISHQDRKNTSTTSNQQNSLDRRVSNDTTDAGPDYHSLNKSQSLQRGSVSPVRKEETRNVPDNTAVYDEIESMKRKMNFLENKVNRLEEYNSDQKRINSDNTALMTNKIQRLTKELDDEKAKKASMEIELKRVKETVDELERTILARMK